MKKLCSNSIVMFWLQRRDKTLKSLSPIQTVLLRPLAVIVLLLVVGFAPWAQAALKVSNPVTGNYNVGTSWVGGVAPTTTDTVQIVNGANITTTSSTSVGSITVDNGGILTVSSTLTCNSSNNPSWLVNGAVNNIGGANTVALGVIHHGYHQRRCLYERQQRQRNSKHWGWSQHHVFVREHLCEQ